MRVYGLDFTSKPTTSKKLTLAVCFLDGATLKVERLEKLESKKDGDFSEFEDWLHGKGKKWSAEKEWIAGIDFPFGMPLGAIEFFGWLNSVVDHDWAAYVAAIHRQSPDVSRFQTVIESWKKVSRTGADKRVFLTRYTDKIATIAGTVPSSTMKVHPQCRPPVGRMFFEGAKRIAASNVSIPPVRVNDEKRVVVEAYPRLVADKFQAGCKYKDGKKLDDRRDLLLKWASQQNPYGVTVSFQDEKDRKDRKDCVEDESGDTIDSVFCAMQAAWSWLVEQDEAKQGSKARTQRYGVPIFSIPCLKKVVDLEGWIVDPLLLESIRPRARGVR